MSLTTANRTGLRGFSLIELCVVLLLISLIIAIALPKYGGFLIRGSLRSEARRMSAMVRYLSNEACRTGVVHYLNFDTDHDQYWVTVASERGKSVEESTHLTRRRELAEGVRFKDLAILSRVGKNQLRHQVAFYPTGESDEAIVHFCDYSKSRFYSLYIKPYNGKTSAYDYYFEGNPLNATAQ